VPGAKAGPFDAVYGMMREKTDKQKRQSAPGRLAVLHPVLALLAGCWLASTQPAISADAPENRLKARAALADMRYLQAVHYARLVLQERPDDPQMLIMIAAAYDSMGAGLADISAAYQRALSVSPSHPGLLANAARFYRRTGNTDYARQLDAHRKTSCVYNCAH